jgi:hypothetical protein
MKKILALTIAIMMLLCFTACNKTSGTDMPQITMGAQQSETSVATDSSQEATEGQKTEAGAAYVFAYQGVKLQPGTAFDASALPEATSTYTVPSCALEGTDNVYNYDAFEVTAYNEGKGEFIYSIYFIDPNLTTPEGLALGDSLDKAISLYGDGYTQEDSAYTYVGGNTMLVIILQNDAIASIEYRMVTE